MRKFGFWFISLVLSLGIGFSRIHLGVHYPSDVLAGCAAGVVWVATVKFVNDMGMDRGADVAFRRLKRQKLDNPIDAPGRAV